MGAFNVPVMTLRYSGLFDFDGLYTAVIDWAKHYGYKWHELNYKHKVPNPKGAEQELDWVIDKKVTEYISFQVTFTIHSWEQTEVEVEVEGKRKPLTNAKIYMIIRGTVGYDWQKKFGGSKLAKKLGDWYSDVVHKKEIESIYHDQLYYRIQNLHSILKKYFDMQTQKYAYKGYLGEH
ncbi:MAG: hypothetical protein AABX13_02975 [Nanoarchaeota archaeon]